MAEQHREPMIVVQVWENYEEECYEYNIPAITPWNDIETMVRLVHPGATSVTIVLMGEG